jgi:thymidylate synthase (FAD)
MAETPLDLDEPLAQTTTGRATVAAMEEILGKTFPVLDHGFVRVVDYMGDDAAIVQAARVSYGKGTRKTREDRGLIRYLMRHKHTTPFEMCELKLHVKLPIFVARQWIRHRTANVNEISARYSVLDREFYIPEPDQMTAQAATNRQGRGDLLPPERAEELRRLLRDDALTAYDHYQRMLNLDADGNPLDPDAQGLTRELARMDLPVSYYTQWYWKVDLHNLMHFLRLRMDSHAQYEIRVYAEVIGQVVERWVPAAWEAFRDYALEAVSLSRLEAQAIRALLAGEQPDYAAIGMSPREVRELEERFGLVRSP